MNATPSRIYLDNAATSWPKPPAVYDAVDHYQRHVGASAGRSAYRDSTDVAAQIAETRRRAAELIGAPRGRSVIFTCNGTESLNLALHGTLRPGDHVVTSASEHNSVLRPLRYLHDTAGVQVTVVPCDHRGLIDPDAVAAAIRPETRMIAMIHASNVTGAIQPIREIGCLARDHEVLFLVDAAQSLGHIPVDVQACHIDLLAAPGHKGLLGPLGTGILYATPEAEQRLRPLRQGGTGTNSENEIHPCVYPDGFEAGNLNVPGVIGMLAALRFLEHPGLDARRKHEQELTRQLIDGFSAIRGVTVLGPREASSQVGVVSITLDDYDPQEVAAMLDATEGIQVRSGLHCAPRIHAALGTRDRGGAIRFSTGPFNTSDEVHRAVHAIAELSAAGPPS
jgi:cysteine desulfurase family protein